MAAFHGPNLPIIAGMVISVGLLVASVGMRATLPELLSVFRSPVRLLKAVVAVNVVVPVAGAVMLAVFPLVPVVKLGVMVMTLAPAPPLIARRDLQAGCSKSYTLGLYAALATLSIIIVPVSVAIISRLYGVTAIVGPIAVAERVVATLIVPLLIGLGFRRLAPRTAERLAPIIDRSAMILLALGAIWLVAAFWPAMRDLIGNGTILAMVLVTAIALAAGHLLGGPDLGERAPLALMACARHPGIALLIATAVGADRHVPAAILGFLLVGLIVSTPYQIWMKRRLEREAGAPAALAATPPGAVAR
ncbi:MAG: hypothetical protein JO111_01935 [Caulobacteraceae bacterium]|nr:hypothetical protein [Caulobacteraceae bacterium]